MKGSNTNIGSYILNKEDLLIQYNKNIIDMQNPENDVHMLLLIGLIKKEINFLGNANLTLDLIVERCGCTTKNKGKEINKTFRTMLNKLINENYIITNKDINLIKNNEVFTISLVKDNDLYKHDRDFVMITVSDFDKIISYKSTNKSIKTGTLLNTYLAIKQYIFKENNGIAYPSKNSIAKIIGVKSTTTVENAVNALVELNLVYLSDDYYIPNKDGSNTYIQTRKLYGLTQESLKNTKVALREIYGSSKVYSSAEIDNKKIIRLKRR